ncbi:hydroxymethylglutaryl-CoA lyase [Noviherbaspirillum sedimenti]|uniref:Hydroxymethylglutaryl-CoA lyase n=1 Tax=Noviherbaspirillum sedimenti TaxID=2320865 RepID=A0A3A3G493_9BURK|nr:hydroxymethylglutaryl-CoA lyase [Noviherbaspirillum sedimenti]RJG02664.1 hydroxymethylglutaryl-CoA lyase [Noviherbaspirillum sedimenti]
MSDIPRAVIFHEEGPREGLQIEKQIFPLSERIELVNALGETGLSQIQVGSFVNPKAVPSMADIDQLFAGITPRKDVRYTALWLNEAGFRRAMSTQNVDISAFLMLYTTDALSQRNNNCSVANMQQRQRQWVQLYQDAGKPIESAYIVTAFGCNLQGEVPLSVMMDSVRFIVDLSLEHGFPLPRIMLADTVGWANPEEIKRRVGAVREAYPEAKLGLHLHDTRGIGAANFFAALQMGVDLFDSSVAGLGGCPFANHANSHGAGNICTEDMVFMCEEMGISTGVDLDRLIEAALLAERMFGRSLTGKLMHAGRPKRAPLRSAMQQTSLN